MHRVLDKVKGSARRFGRNSAKIAPENVDDLKQLGKDLSDLAAQAIARNWEGVTYHKDPFGTYVGTFEELRNDWLKYARNDLCTNFVAKVASKRKLWKKVSARWKLCDFDELVSLYLLGPITKSGDEIGHHHVAVLEIQYRWRLRSESDSTPFEDSYKRVIRLPETWEPVQEEGNDVWATEGWSLTDYSRVGTLQSISVLGPDDWTLTVEERLLFGIDSIATLPGSTDLSGFGLPPSGADVSTSLTN